MDCAVLGEGGLDSLSVDRLLSTEPQRCKSDHDCSHGLLIHTDDHG